MIKNNLITNMGIFLICVSLVIVLVKFIKTSNGKERLVIVDFFSMIVLTFISIAAYVYKEVLMLNIGNAIALLSFISTIAIAKFLDKH